MSPSDYAGLPGGRLSPKTPRPGGTNFHSYLELRYFRDVLGHEIDFVLLRRGKPWIAVDVKSGTEAAPRPGFRYLLERVRFSLGLRVGLGTASHVHYPDINGAEVHSLPAEQFLAALA